MNKKIIPSLNGLRAICIILVITDHYKVLHYFNDTFITYVFPSRLLEYGGMGVSVFFVISGFLITKLLMNEEQSTNKVSLKNFYIRRILRIFPAYYSLLFIYFILQHFNLIYLSKSSWISALSYSNFLKHSKEPITAHLWSLSVEEYFYFFWPFIFTAFPKKRTYISCLLIFILPFIRIYGYNHIISSFFEISNNTIFQKADSLMIGCLLALYYKESIVISKKLFVFIKFPKLCLFAFFCAVVFVDFINKKYNLHLGFITVPILGAGGTLTLIFIGILILYSVKITEGWWYKFLNCKLMDYIGRLSYSLYLWQQIILLGSLGIISQKPYSLLFVFIAANISYYLIEKPFLRLKSKF